MFSSHPSEPMVDQRRFSDPSPRNDCNDVDILVFPRTIQESDILFATKNIASCNGQSGYGNLLRWKFCLRHAGYGAGSGRTHLGKKLVKARIFSERVKTVISLELSVSNATRCLSR